MRNSANFISSQSQGCDLIFHSEKGDGGGCFGCWAEIVIICSQLGNSNLGDKGEMEEGWGLKSGKMLRRDNRICCSTQQTHEDCAGFSFTKCLTKQKRHFVL